MFISMKTTLLDIINEPKVLNPISYNSEPPFLMTEKTLQGKRQENRKEKYHKGLWILKSQLKIFVNK